MPGLGRLRSIDPRNEQFLMHRRLAPEAALAVPERKTWGFRGAPLDQGETGTCVSHAAVHFIHCSPLPHAGFIDPYDLYREVVLLDEYHGNDHEAAVVGNDGLQAGSSGTGGAKALHKRGLISEYLWARRMEDCIAWVLTRGPVMVGTNWYSGMFTPTPEGYIKITGAVSGGHEWLIRGVDRKRGVALMVNSWGGEWGGGAEKWQGRPVREGHALVDFETLARLFHEEGDAVSCLEVAGP